MNPFESLSRKDTISAFLLWLCMAFVGFILLPSLGIIQPEGRLFIWVATGIPLGLGGSLLVGASSEFIASANRADPGITKQVLIWAGQAAGWLGLMGVMYPVLMVALEFFAKSIQELGNVLPK
ncbi:hypothetical protein [Trichothermofontia sp.]